MEFPVVDKPPVQDSWRVRISYKARAGETEFTVERESTKPWSQVLDELMLAYTDTKGVIGGQER